jgi:arylsulfatase A
MKKILLSLIAVYIAATALAAKPNIVILYADDLGLGDLRCFNPDSKIPTPNLDKLAAEGTRFTDAHSSSGICTPSRYAMLTGRHHWRDFHGIDTGFDKPFFKNGQLTLQEMFRKSGYATACIGKWHLGWDWDSIRKPGTPPKSKSHADFDWTKPFRGGPLDHGFDHYFGDNVINFPPYAWIENDKFPVAPDIDFTETTKATKEGSWECRPGPGRSDWDFYKILPTLTEKGVEYIRSRKGNEQPFFLYFPLPSPHAPIIPNDKFDGTSKAGAYGDFVVQTDDSCGQLLNALREAGVYENTIIIFSTDNGAERYAYPRDEKFDHWSTHPLRGLKRDIYEGGHRVPTIIKWPGLTKPGTESAALISQIDFIATFASALNFELPENAAEDSHDLLPLLKGEKESVRTTHVHNTNLNSYAIRHGKWTLIDAKTGYVSGVDKEWEKRHGYKPDDKSPVELYDMEKDIGQKNNLAEVHPEIVKELQNLLKKIREQGHSAPRLKKE